MGPRAGLDAVAKEKLCPFQDLNPGRLAHSLVIMLTETSRLPSYVTPNV